LIGTFIKTLLLGLCLIALARGEPQTDLLS